MNALSLSPKPAAKQPAALPKLLKMPLFSTKYSASAALKKGKAAYRKGDYESALSWLEAARTMGSATAARYIGLIHKQNTAPHHLQQAFAAFSCAARSGDTVSQYYLAQAYEYGTGTVKNLTQAKYWYRQSARRENESAAMAWAALGRWCEKGISAPADLFEAVIYYQQAAAFGNAEAKAALKRLGG